MCHKSIATRRAAENWEKRNIFSLAKILKDLEKFEYEFTFSTVFSDLNVKIFKK